MNNMKKQEKSKPLQSLSMSVGDFIRYWGFRRIHGAVWTQVYLSETPVSCTELTKRLGLSKALISPALEDLRKYELIHLVPSGNEKTKLYAPADDINAVIRKVLQQREVKMLEKITADYAHLESSALASGSRDSFIDKQKLKNLGEMIQNANMVLSLLVAQEDFLSLPKLKSL